MDFNRYIEVFNSGDDDALVDGWFTDDIVYFGANRKIEGKEAWRGFLKFAHDGVREIFRPQNLFQNDINTVIIDGYEVRIGSSSSSCALWPLFFSGPGFEERVKTLNERYSRDKALVFPFLENTFRDLYKECGALVIATPQMGLFPYYLKKRYPRYDLYFIDTRGLCDQRVALMDLEGGPFGIEAGGSLGRIIQGEAGPLSDYVRSKKPNLLYRVAEQPQVIEQLERLGYQVAFLSKGAIFFFNPRIRMKSG